MPHARHQQENFPVASRLCPPALRAPILAIYQFARTADDLADEGDRPVGERRALLERMRVQLAALPERPDPAAPWTAPLAQAIAASALARAESCGGHRRTDFPATDPSLDGIHLIFQSDGTIEPRSCP